MRSPRSVIMLSAVAVALSGCAGPPPIGSGATAPSPSPSPSPPSPSPWTSDGAADPSSTPDGVTAGTFMPRADDFTPDAVTYDPSVVPPGATAQLEIGARGAGLAVTLQVAGMVPRRSYGAHLHTSPCTAIPAQAGPHYQHEPDPKATPSEPSTDPAFANPANEVWLDFTADASGAASTTAVEDWAFDEDHPPGSLIVHSDVTRTGAGVAGMAGPRVACLTLTLARQPGHLVGARR